MYSGVTCIKTIPPKGMFLAGSIFDTSGNRYELMAQAAEQVVVFFDVHRRPRLFTRNLAHLLDFHHDTEADVVHSLPRLIGQPKG